jgi:hypothetical protein
VQWAVQQLTGLRYEPWVRHELLRQLKERRADAGEDVVQFDWLPAEVGFDTLLVKGELLITTESYFGYPGGLRWNDRAQSARPYLDALGLQPGRVECAELADKIVRLVPSKHLDAHVLADIARNLRLRGFAASFNYCTPTAPVHKHPLVAGIVNRVAPYAPVRMYRAVDGDGLASEVDVACAMIEAVKDGNQIINLSLGCQTQDDFPPVALEAALAVIAELDARKPDEEKTIIVATAGNCGDRRPFYPAAFFGAGYSAVVSVAGLNPNMTPSPWSSRGFWVTCSTVGQGIPSTYVYGKESPLIDPAETEFLPPDPFAVWSGTSFAAPQIAGAIAQLYQAPGVSLRGALHELLQVAVPIPDFGRAVQILRGI